MGATTILPSFTKMKQQPIISFCYAFQNHHAAQQQQQQHPIVGNSNNNNNNNKYREAFAYNSISFNVNNNLLRNGQQHNYGENAITTILYNTNKAAGTTMTGGSFAIDKNNDKRAGTDGYSILR